MEDRQTLFTAVDIAGWRLAARDEADAIALVNADDGNFLPVEAAVPERRLERAGNPVVSIVGDIDG